MQYETGEKGGYKKTRALLPLGAEEECQRSRDVWGGDGQPGIKDPFLLFRLIKEGCREVRKKTRSAKDLSRKSEGKSKESYRGRLKSPTRSV